MTILPDKFPTRTKLRELRVFNSFELCKRGGSKIHVSYMKSGNGSYSGWLVYGTGFVTDPKGALVLLHGNTKFTGGLKADQLQEALKFASKWGGEEWVRDPWGAYQPAKVLAWARQAVKEAK